jgi:predicted glycogen debranching enzyme
MPAMLSEPTRSVPLHTLRDPDSDPHLHQEWLVTNGLGGYASGTVSGAVTRRYHGLLIAALPNPLGRMLLLNTLLERVCLPDGRIFHTAARELIGNPETDILPVAEFRLEAGLPVWRYETDGFAFEKRLIMPYRQNTVHIVYRLLNGNGTVQLGLRPAVHFRSHDASVSADHEQKYRISAREDQFEITAGSGLPALRMKVYGETSGFTFDRNWTSGISYRAESVRGYASQGSLWSPGTFSVDIQPDKPAALVASAEHWNTIYALTPEAALASELRRRRQLLAGAGPLAKQGFAAELVLAADQFVIQPVGRTEDAARARAAGDEIRAIIAGYHWFTDWGRDTMISLEGLTLVTGRQTEAGWILRQYAQYVRDGLIPNLFPEGENEGLYHTADATLWFFHAIHRYLRCTGDRTTLALLLQKLVKIIHRHMEGTRFGIRMDPADGLLTQGAEGYQLTWMDAKVGDWVVTPRRGKAVEINALWYNALRLIECWVRQEGGCEAEEFRDAAERARSSFNARFWNPRTGYLYDVVDGENGDDDACRPNQVFSISLDNPVLDEVRWEPVLAAVTEHLLTPAGLRSLSPGNPEYKPQYYGDLRSRDAAYHQGTVWAWLIGPYIDAWLKVNPGDPSRARRFLEGFHKHREQACVGSISEIFDAHQPHTPRGAVAQAWSVAEVLRAWAKTAG